MGEALLLGLVESVEVDGVGRALQDGPVAVDSKAIDAFDMATNLLVGSFEN